MENNNGNIIKCPGCGAIIQTNNPNEAGYIKEEVLNKRLDSFLCMRCFKLKHYNEVKTVKEELTDINNIFKKIANEENLIVNIVDSFDLLGSVIPNINELFPKSKILIVCNKYDLFMRSNRPTKLRTYLKNYFKNKNIKFCDLIVTSSLDEKSGKPIYEAIKQNYNNKNVYFVGMCNVGKSTLLNTISKYSLDNLRLTTSIQVGTTLDVNAFKLNEINFFDTPGYYNQKQATYYLNKKSLNLTMPKKYIKPRIYQLYKNDTIFINGYGYLTYMGDVKCGIAFYVANTLMLYRTKNDPIYYYNKHINDFLTIPNEQERKDLGKLITYEINVLKTEELCISGIGFLSFSENAFLKLSLYEKIDVEKRNKLI